MGQFHQHRHAAGAVIGPHEHPLGVGWIAIGKGTRVVVGRQQHASEPFGVPFHDQVFHRHRLPGAPIANLKALPRHPGASRLEVGLQERPLPLHHCRSTRPRSQARHGFQMGHRRGAGKLVSLVGPSRGGGPTAGGDQAGHDPKAERKPSALRAWPRGIGEKGAGLSQKLHQSLHLPQAKPDGLPPTTKLRWCAVTLKEKVYRVPGPTRQPVLPDPT